MTYPDEVERLHTAIATLPGVLSVSSAVESLEGVAAEDLRFPQHGHLPHGALRRTGGGLAAESLIQVEFYLEQSHAGWLALEFIAWFVRDQARGGEFIQLRPFALPPMVGDEVQLGNSLRWHMDLFCVSNDEGLTAELQRVREIAEQLEITVKIYGDLLEANRA